MDEFEVVGKLCKVAVVEVSEIFRDECFDPVSVYCYKDCEKRREKQDARGTAGHMKAESLVKLGGAAFDFTFDLLGALVLGDMTSDF